MMKWFLTTRSGFWWLLLQSISTVCAQVCLRATDGLDPVFLVLPVLLAPLVAWTLWTNWMIRHRYCQHCGGRAVMCHPVCIGVGRIVDSETLDSTEEEGTR